METQNRVIFTNSLEVNKVYKYPSNYQSTTKYNLITFIPKSLLLQFKRVANIYFLLIAILESISIISPLSSFSAIAPLIFVLTVSVIREGVEDYMRHKADKEINSVKILIYRDGRFCELTSKDVKVGDILLISKDSVFPADLVLLSSCNETGIAYIETSTLDGEKNLKPRQSLQPTSNMDINSDLGFVYKIECELPNPKIYSFSGFIEIENNQYSIDKNNLLLSGSFLRNTQNIIGVVIFTGNDTKLRQNLMAKTSKQSKIESKVNKYIWFIMSLQLLMCVGMGYGARNFITNDSDDHNYIYIRYSSNIQGVITIFTYFILLNTMLPISLIISLELLKVSQGYFMQNDLEMYSQLRDRPCKVSTYNISEELGMVQHIFSDKTGTLTCNRMEFKFCSVGNKVYGNPKFLKDLEFVSASTYSTREIIFTFDTKEISNDLFSKAYSKQKLLYDIKSYDSHIKYQHEIAGLFVRCMALCHECLIDYEDGVKKYAGQSPDEITLVDAARHIGIEYESISKNIITLMVHHFDRKEEEKYEKICLIEFDSDRKRNSIILKDLRKGNIILFVKGADNIIKSRLHPRNPKEYLDLIEKDLLEYSKRGLRTLLLAFRYIPYEEFKKWKKKYDEAYLSIESRQEKIAEITNEIEQNLMLLGCTAVEDALQTEVPATIKSILSAGIKFWMLTGDKLETAINISRTCGIITNEMQVFICDQSQHEKCQATLKKILLKIKRKPSALVVEGQSLEAILSEDKKSGTSKSKNQATGSKGMFLEISKKCKTVVCCRVTPGQKREIVQMMKKETGCISLSVGDGANDVSMILEADVGVGIYGEEGLQAIQASDYGIGEFRFLWELLLAHGRYNYLRVSEMILYFFYKNIVFTFPQFIFAFYCGFSGKSVYDDWYITLYNTIFTATPLMTKALFEKDVIIPKRNVGNQQEALIRSLVPHVYCLGRENQVFTVWNFMLWYLSGIFQSVLVFFLPLYALEAGIIDSKGRNSDFWGFSIISFTCVVFLVNLKLSFYTRLWNKIHVFSIFFLSILLYLIFMIIYDFYSPTTARGSVIQIIQAPYFYLILMISIVVSFIVDEGLHILRRATKPTTSEILMDYSINYHASKVQDRPSQKPYEEQLIIN